ncbi:MAG: hypothetical protein KDC10_12660 [Calditrichaeota bacterium]|nr:hypothetical protein [Calditrichota bacterium]
MSQDHTFDTVLPENAGDPKLDLWAEARRNETRMKWLTVVVLLGLTLYVVGLNFFLLARTHIVPLEITLDGQQKMLYGEEYAAGIRWDTPMKRDLIHPRLYIEGVPVPEFVDTLHSDVKIQLGTPNKLMLDIPLNCDPGKHSGVLVLKRLSSNDALPASIQTQVNLNVLGGFWENWLILKYWLYCLSFLAVLIYCVCLITYPAPSGNLLVLESTNDTFSPVALKLQVRWVGRLLPWKRSTFPMGHLLSKAGIGFSRRYGSHLGRLTFWDRELPVIEIHDRSRVLLEKCSLDGESARRTGILADLPYRSCGTVELMYSFYQFKISIVGSSTDTVLIRYQQDYRA